MGLIGALAVSPLYGKKKAAAPEPRSAIREFDIETLGVLGRDIYRHDQLAWVATDLLLATISQDDLVKEGAGGWIVDTTEKNVAKVRFLRVTEDNTEAAYDIVFYEGMPPALVKPEDRTLTPYQALAAKAQSTATASLFDGSWPWCGGNANTVVLPDPDGSGFLVYFLRAKPEVKAVPVGGHYRVTVSADGTETEQVDQLFASCLTMDRESLPDGSEVVVLMASHVISRTPVETHVFLSLQEKLPFSIVTPDDEVWYVGEGRIYLYGHVSEGKVIQYEAQSD